jgi:uncharacterized protein
MILLLISFLPLLLGSILVQALFRRPRLIPMLDGFVLVSVGGIVFLHILPESIVHGGWGAAAAALLGVVLPFFFERRLGAESGKFSGIALLALCGLGIHGMLDGVALAAGDVGAENGWALALGVVIHRLPAGLGIWGFARGRLGIRGALLLVAILILFSCVGFGVSLAYAEIFDNPFWYVLQALLVGSLAHVLLHKPILPPKAEGKKELQIASALGAVLGGTLLFALAWIEFHDHSGKGGSEIGRTFMILALESAPPILLGFGLASVMHGAAFDRIYRWLGTGSKCWQALEGAVVGLPLNICSCAVLPVYRVLIGNRVSKQGALAFLITAPEIGITVILLSISLLGLRMSLFRVGAALALGIGVSLFANGASGRTTTLESLPSVPTRSSIPPGIGDFGSVKARFVQGCRYGFGELLDHTMPWILAGIGMAAILAPMISPRGLSDVPVWAQVPSAAAAGIPLYICATGSTPLVALLMQKGFSAGAGLALLLSGPATNIATFGMLAKLHGKRFAFFTAAGLVGFSVVLGYLFDAATVGEPLLPSQNPGEDEYGLISWGSFVVLGGLLVRSILRQGVRGFTDQILNSHGHEHGEKEVY